MKEEQYHSGFHEYLKKNLSSEQYDILPHMLGCSPHRRTSLIKQPEVARHDEVLFFSRLLKKPVLELMKEFGLGTEGLTDREKELHRHISDQVQEAVLSE